MNRNERPARGGALSETVGKTTPTIPACGCPYGTVPANRAERRAARRVTGRELTRLQVHRDNCPWGQSGLGDRAAYHFAGVRHGR